MTSQEKAVAIGTALLAKKASNVLVFDLREVSSFTDFFVLASGTSRRHVKALAEETLRAAREEGERALGVEGDPPGRWILVDLDDVVVHLFEPEAREFYGLERLWGEAERMELPEAEADLAEVAR